MRGPGPHHPPPADLSARRLPLASFEAPWFRLHAAQYGALFFGRTGTYRFDAPAAEFGVLYVGADAHCAFIETFGHATGTNFVTVGELAARCLSRVTASRPLRLVDLRGEGLARLGADARLSTGESYAASQAWSLALHQHRDEPDGIAFTARHDPSRLCAALFERTSPLLQEERRSPLLEQPELLRTLLDHYAFGLVD